MDVRFICTHATQKRAAGSRHRVLECCESLKKVLALNPYYGLSIPGHGDLRKMRVAVPNFNMGKSGGYRAIYQAKTIDEAVHIVFLSIYFKGDQKDLSHAEYDGLLATAAEILGDPLTYEWEDFSNN